MPSPTLRTWQSDSDYIADQDAESSWSHKSSWGESAAMKFVHFGKEIDLFHDDTVADFGGNDGYAAYNFYLRHKVKPIVVDCEPKRLDHASKVYLLPTLQRFIEEMPELADKSVDWGFCSHTLEHCRDAAKAFREISRVVSRMCYFVVPLEEPGHAKENHAHAICFQRPIQWRRMAEANGWRVLKGKRMLEPEYHFIGVPA